MGTKTLINSKDLADEFNVHLRDIDTLIADLDLSESGFGQNNFCSNLDQGRDYCNKYGFFAFTLKGAFYLRDKILSGDQIGKIEKNKKRRAK